MAKPKSVKYNSIRAGQTLWIANPHCGGYIERVLVSSKPKTNLVKTSYSNDYYLCFFYGLSKSFEDKLIEKRFCFNAGGFIKIFRTEKLAKKYLNSILNNSDFCTYDNIRLENIDSDMCCFSSEEIERNLFKKLINIFTPQNFNLPILKVA